MSQDAKHPEKVGQHQTMINTAPRHLLEGNWGIAASQENYFGFGGEGGGWESSAIILWIRCFLIKMFSEYTLFTTLKLYAAGRRRRKCWDFVTFTKASSWSPRSPSKVFHLCFKKVINGRSKVCTLFWTLTEELDTNVGFLDFFLLGNAGACRCINKVWSVGDVWPILPARPGQFELCEVRDHVFTEAR